MKVKRKNGSIYLEAENKIENEAIAVIVNRLDLRDKPALWQLEGCKQKGKKFFNYITIPEWEENENI